MSISLLEMQRARKALDDFCAQRNTRLSGADKLICDQHENSLLIGQRIRSENDSNPERFCALVRLSYEDGRWLLFLSDKKGDWQPYPHLPEADNVRAIVEELEQAPLQVHW